MFSMGDHVGSRSVPRNFIPRTHRQQQHLFFCRSRTSETYSYFLQDGDPSLAFWRIKYTRALCNLTIARQLASRDVTEVGASRVQISLLSACFDLVYVRWIRPLILCFSVSLTLSLDSFILNTFVQHTPPLWCLDTLVHDSPLHKAY